MTPHMLLSGATIGVVTYAGCLRRAGAGEAIELDLATLWSG